MKYYLENLWKGLRGPKASGYNRGANGNVLPTRNGKVQVERTLKGLTMNIVVDPNDVHKSKSKDSLASETFAAFAPYINVFDPGVKALMGMDKITRDLVFSPVHMIPRIVWQLNREYKEQKAAGVAKPRIVYPSGERVFNPGIDMAIKILSEDHCAKACKGNETYYFTSGKHTLGMIYGDVDAHFEFQTDKDRASRFFRAAFPFAFHCESGRGTNELVKVAHMGDHNKFNELCSRLQGAMCKVFNSAKILCDFEVKGTCTTEAKSGSLAKLPWNRQWNYSKLETFLACQTISLYALERIIVGLEQNADDSEWAAHRDALKKAETAAKVATAAATKVATQVATAATKVATPEATAALQAAPIPSMAPQGQRTLKSLCQRDLRKLARCFRAFFGHHMPQVHRDATL